MPTTPAPLYVLTGSPSCQVGVALRLGDEGEAVRCLQLRLDQVTPSSDVAVNGVFGAETDSQVRLFQAVHSLTADGIVGPQTAGLLGIWNPTPAAPPAAQPVIGRSDVYYENCTAVRAAGADPIRRGEPGYRSDLDADDDGVGCE